MTPQATGRHEVRQGQDVMVLTRTFRSSIEHVWAALTQPDRMASWIGTWDGDPASGSVNFRMTAEGDDAAEQRWEIRTCEPPHTLVVRSSDDSGAWELELRLVEHDEITTLEFAHVIHDVSVLGTVGPGWEYYLDRLMAAETGGDASTIAFEPDYYPGLSGHYAALMTPQERT